jgi:hypothetical protein
MQETLFLILDCETCTIPIDKTLKEKMADKDLKKISILKPLIYDIAWQVVNRKGEVRSKHSYLVTETFLNNALFETAYYKDKKPLYIEKLQKKTITLKAWNDIISLLLDDLTKSSFCGAYNSMFDFKKALNFTDDYIRHLYSGYEKLWLEMQEKSIEKILNGEPLKNPNFDKNNFIFREKYYPLIDLWGLSCENLLNTKKFKNFAIENKLFSPSLQYYSTNAETTYKFLTQNTNFIESHTAFEDVEIETEIFISIMKKTSIKKMTKGIIYFPFRLLGKIPIEENEE